MDPFTMVAAIVAIACTTSLVQEWLKRRPGDSNLRREMQALRDEVERLRQQNNEVVLSFDATLKHVEKRLENVESRVALPRPSETGETVGLTAER
jgi:hypothetical protein